MPRQAFWVRGRVQGVGFRWFVCSLAEELGVRGWVRNEPDGSVRGEAQAAEEVLQGFWARLRQGPAHARVEALSCEDLAEASGEGFELRR